MEVKRGIRSAISKNRIYSLLLFFLLVIIFTPSTLHSDAIDSFSITIKEWNIPNANTPTDVIIVNEKIFFGGIHGHMIGRLDPTTNTFTEWAVPGGGEAHTQAESNGIIYYSDYTDGSIGSLDPFTNTFTTYHNTSVSHPQGVAILAGDLYFCENTAGKIGRVNPATLVFTEWNIPSGSSAEPQNLIASEGHIYFIEYGGKLGRLNPSTNEISEWDISSYVVNLLHALEEHDGMIYFGDRSNILGRLNPETNEVTFWNVPYGNTPFQISYDINSNEYYFTMEYEGIGGYIGRLNPIGGTSYTIVPSTSIITPNAITISRSYDIVIPIITEVSPLQHTVSGIVSGNFIMWSQSGTPVGIDVGSNFVAFAEYDGNRIGAFAHTQYYLIVNNGGHGTASGEGWYDAGATAYAGLDTDVVTEGSTRYIFIQWSGDANGAVYSQSDPITMTTPKTATAQWETQYYIEVVSDYGFPISSSWVTQGDDYPTSVTSPDSGYVCDGYKVDSGDLQTGTSYTFTNVQAPHSIEYVWSLNEVSITVTSDPAGSRFVKVDGIDYDTPYLFNWVIGSTHSLEALSPVSGGSGVQYVYQSWSDGGEQTHSYTVPSSDETVTANYAVQYYLTVNNGGHGTASGEGWYDSGSSATFSITPETITEGNTRYVFQGWVGDYTGSENPHSITMDGAKEVTAQWETQYYIEVVSDYGFPTSSSWVTQGDDYPTSVTSPDGEYVCSGYRIDDGDLQTGTSYTFTNIQAPHTIEYIWSPAIEVPPNYLASNPIGRVFFIFNDKKYYITNPYAFNSYGLNWDDIVPHTEMNPNTYQSSQINYDYILDGNMPLPDRDYIAGDVDDGSLYWIPYYTWDGEKYPITWEGYNAYSGYLLSLPIRYGDPAMSLPTSLTILDRVNPIPDPTVPSYVIASNPMGRVYFIFNGYKYYFTTPAAYSSYGFDWDDIDPTVNPDDYPSAQVSFDYLLEDPSSIFRKPLPNQPYIVGDVNDGSLYWIPYYTSNEEKYPITDMNAFNTYGFTPDMIRFGDAGILLPTSSYLLDGVNPIPYLYYP